MATRVAVVVVMVVSAACIPFGRDDGETGLACQVAPEGELLPVERDGDVIVAPEFPELVGLTPEQAAERLEPDDLAVSWRYSYATDVTDRRVGYSECWCIPPPDGVVQDASVTEGGWLIVTVARDGGIVGGRPQPRLGWGCDDAAPSEGAL